MEELKDVEIEIIDEETPVGEESPSNSLDTQEEADDIEIVEEDDNNEKEEISSKKKNKTASYIDKLKAELKEAKKLIKETSSKPSVPVDSLDEIKLLRFEMKNPDADKYMDDIKELISQNPNLGYERAYALIKAEKGESQTIQNFSISNKKVIRKKLGELTQEEAISKFKNDPISYMKWRKAAGIL